MIVRYSSLNRLEKPNFTLCNPGSIYANGILSKVIGMLVDTEAEEIVFNFNATSELNLRVNHITREDSEENAHVYSIYRAVQNRRLIFVEDVGYFMITNIEDGFDGFNHYKDVTAKSIDIEIAQKMLPFIDNGTYRFSTDKTGANKGLLEMVVESLPLWTINHVDDIVAERWRTFEDTDTSLNCLAFMLQNMQDAYECIFVFNNITRTISVYDQANYIRQTNIHITKDDLINSLDITENADDLYTAVSVLGDDNLTISAINPLGTNVIYDFSYYLSWMSKPLRAKVVKWQNAIEGERESYYNLNLDYFIKMTEKSSLEMEIDKLDTQIEIYYRCRNNIVAQYSTELVESYNEVIIEAGGKQITIQDNVEETLAEIDKFIAGCESSKQSNHTTLSAKQAELDDAKVRIAAVCEKLSMASYFTVEEYAELCNYIFEGTYSDEYVVITDIMSYDEKFSQMKILYDRAMLQLKKASHPTQEFSVDVESFIFVKEFEAWSEQLETGCLINVELNVNDIASLFLSNMTINYDDHSFSMTFGNRFNKFDPKSLYDDVLGKISKSANTLNYIKEAVYSIRNSEHSAIQEALQTSRNLTMGAALASENEEVVIDSSGYTGRRLLPNGEYDPRQIKIISNSIVFTDDAWDSCALALGNIILDDNTTIYGINAQAIFGDMIIGGGLKIYDKNGNEILSVIDGIQTRVTTAEGDISSLEQTVDGFTLSVSNGDASSTISLKSGNTTISSETIRMTGLVSFSDLSTSGKTTIHGGNITTGTLSADKITSGTLDADKVTISNLTVDAASITSGTIASARIPNLSADKITSGTISGSRIDGSTLVITTGATIAGWSIDSNSIYKSSGDWGSGTFMCTGSTGSYSIGGSGTIAGWVFGAGGNFGVTSSGAVWCSNLRATGGRIGGWIISSNTIRTSSGVYGTHKWDNEGVVMTMTGYIFTALTSSGVYYAVSGSDSYAAAAYTFHFSCLISSTGYGSSGSVEL